MRIGKVWAKAGGFLVGCALLAGEAAEKVTRQVRRATARSGVGTAALLAAIAAAEVGNVGVPGQSTDRYSVFQTNVERGEGGDEPNIRGMVRHNLLTTTATGYTNGYDWLAAAMGSGPSAAFSVAQGFATSTTSTSLTAATGFPTTGNGLAGQIVVAGPNNAGTGSKVYGVILTNSATVLTVDQWYDPTSTTGASGSTPNGTCSYVVVPGQNPAAWLCLSASVFSPATSDQSLGTQGAELTTNGFSRAVGTWAHTHAGSTYTLIHLWTATGTSTINNEGVSGAATYSASTPFGGVFPFESAEPSPPTLVSGDTLQNTITVTI